jgi:hypothetical protein
MMIVIYMYIIVLGVYGGYVYIYTYTIISPVNPSSPSDVRQPSYPPLLLRHMRSHFLRRQGRALPRLHARLDLQAAKVNTWNILEHEVYLYLVAHPT